MKSGKKRNTDTVQPPSPPPPSAALVGDGEDSVGEERVKNQNSEKFETELEPFEDGGDEDFPEAEKELEQLQNFQIEDAEGKRMKLAEGYYEIEAVRRKRVRKGKTQYLIKWRGWSEAENTWEPVENLVQCLDIIDAFEDSLKGGKTKSSGKRGRKPKKQHHQQEQQSPSAAAYTEPVSFPSPNNFTCMNENDIMNTTGNTDEDGKRMEEKDKNESGLELCDPKDTSVVTANGDGDADRLAIVTFKEGDNLPDELRKTESVRFTGAKKRKSGSVKRFKKDLSSCSMDDVQNGLSGCGPLVPVGDKCPCVTGNDANKYEDSKSECVITHIVKPVSYKASMVNDVQEVLVAFEAVGSDGSRVIVDNRFLKANNPLLLIDFYERNLRYSPM